MGRRIFRGVIQRGLQLGFLASTLSLAQESQSKSDYNLEAGPTLGRTLPSEVQGAHHPFTMYGLRAAVPLGATGALETGLLYHVHGKEKINTFDIGYRYETNVEGLNFLADIGFHISKFKLQPDYTRTNSCEDANCATDTGTHFGFYAGGGMQFPLAVTIPFRLRMRFYRQPSYWLLLELGLALRF